MLKPIPPRILTTSGTLNAPVDTDRYGKPTYETYELKKTHLQPSNSVKKTRDNREVVLRSLLFCDVRLSLPHGLDFDKLHNKAQNLGADLELELNGQTYHVETVELIPDDTGRPHHYEIGLI